MRKYIWTVLLLIPSLLSAAPQVTGKEKSKTANIQHDNFFRNPVLGGDYPDSSILRVGKDYYLTNSSFEYYPGLLVWHSTDLVHWERIGYALYEYVGSVWAPDLVKYGDKYYIYFPAGRKNWVVSARSKSPLGPWENSPYNPIVHTGSRNELWWCQGHGSLVDDVNGNHGFLRILNDENEISFYFSNDGRNWNRLERSIDATGFNHNVFGGFMSLRTGLFAFGEGKVRFDNFRYKKL